MKTKPKGYWQNEENCKNAALSCKDRNEFRNKFSQAYMYSRHSIWLSELFPYKCNRLTYEHCKECASKCVSRKDFENQFSSEYQTSWKKGWLEEFFPKKDLSKEHCRECASKCKGRREFQYTFGFEYRKSRKEGWLEEFFPNPIDYSKTKHCIYRYYFEEDNSIYIGLTANIKDRIYRHNTSEKSAVYRHSKLLGVCIPECEILKDKINAEEAQYYEDYYVNLFKEKGYNVLNVGGTGVNIGSLGGFVVRKLTKEYCRECASKCTSRNDFRENFPSEYRKSTKKGWVDEFIPNTFFHKLTYEYCYECASKCKNRNEFKHKYGGAYNKSRKEGWIDYFFPKSKAV